MPGELASCPANRPHYNRLKKDSKKSYLFDCRNDKRSNKSGISFRPMSGKLSLSSLQLQLNFSE